MNAPTLETKHLRLRGHRLEDFEDSAAMWSDPAVTRYIGGKPSSPQQTWMRMLAYAGHWQLLNFGYWVIEEHATGRFAGEIGFADFKRDTAPSMRAVPELGWALPPHAAGKGYATEATRAAAAWADRTFTGNRTVCLIDPDNAASIRVAEKTGFSVFERATFSGRPTLFLERTRPGDLTS